MTRDTSIIYVATGDKFLLECIKSAKSVKEVMPDVPIHIWTDNPMFSGGANFDFVHQIENPSYGFIDKIKPLTQSKTDKTLFVDTDTYFLAPVFDIFSLLDRFDFAYAFSPCPEPLTDKVPPCFREPNSGVLAFNRTEKVMELFQRWEEIYLERPDDPHDQPSLKIALYESDVRAIVLPPEYNFRTPIPATQGMDVRILHGRDPSLSRAIKSVNRTFGTAVYDFSGTQLKKWIPEVSHNLIRRTLRILRKS